MLYFVLTLVDIKMKQSSHPSLFLVFANLCLVRFPACLEMRALGAMYIVAYCSMSLSCLLTEQKVLSIVHGVSLTKHNFADVLKFVSHHKYLLLLCFRTYQPCP